MSYNGAATLSWSASTTNSDGSFLNDLAGFKIYWGTLPNSASTYPSVVDVGNTLTKTFTGLTHNTRYFFAVTAYDTVGNESTFSQEQSKLIIVSTLQLLRRFV